MSDPAQYIPALKWVPHDGGRLAAGFKGDEGDCVVRALAIVTGLDYGLVLLQCMEGNKSEWKGRRTIRGGVDTTKPWFKAYARSLGLVWTPTMGIGTGCRYHLRQNELPNGRLVCMLSGHACAVIDQVIYDNHDPARAGTRCVYGYWKLG